MKLSELIKDIGDDNIAVQSVNLSLVQAKDKKRTGDTEITFATTEVNSREIFANTGKIGLVLWIDREDFAKAELKSKINEEN